MAYHDVASTVHPSLLDGHRDGVMGPAGLGPASIVKAQGWPQAYSRAAVKTARSALAYYRKRNCRKGQGDGLPPPGGSVDEADCPPGASVDGCPV
jgi:hypothetical protein